MRRTAESVRHGLLGGAARGLQVGNNTVNIEPRQAARCDRVDVLLSLFFSLKALCLDGCCCSLGIGLRARSFLVLTCAKNERSKDASTLAWALLVLIADLAIALFDQFGRRAEVLEVIVE